MGPNLKFDKHWRSLHSEDPLAGLQTCGCCVTFILGSLETLASTSSEIRVTPGPPHPQPGGSLNIDTTEQTSIEYFPGKNKQASQWWVLRGTEGIQMFSN